MVQEVTPDIYKIFGASDWWKDYKCSVSLQMAAERGYFCMQVNSFHHQAFFLFMRERLS